MNLEIVENDFSGIFVANFKDGDNLYTLMYDINDKEVDEIPFLVGGKWLKFDTPTTMHLHLNQPYQGLPKDSLRDIYKNLVLNGWVEV